MIQTQHFMLHGEKEKDTCPATRSSGGPWGILMPDQGLDSAVMVVAAGFGFFFSTSLESQMLIS